MKRGHARFCRPSSLVKTHNSLWLCRLGAWPPRPPWSVSVNLLASAMATYPNGQQTAKSFSFMVGDFVFPRMRGVHYGIQHLNSTIQCSGLQHWLKWGNNLTYSISITLYHTHIPYFYNEQYITRHPWLNTWPIKRYYKELYIYINIDQLIWFLITINIVQMQTSVAAWWHRTNEGAEEPNSEGSKHLFHFEPSWPQPSCGRTRRRPCACIKKLCHSGCKAVRVPV